MISFICCSLKVWDVEDLIATYSYSFAHTDIITGTDVKAMCTSIFASTSLDGESLLWDVRRAKPAHCIYHQILSYRFFISCLLQIIFFNIF